jgi:hypothetical protein
MPVPGEAACEPVLNPTAAPLAPDVPTPVWGRDELRTGDLWNSNSVVSWLITRTGLDPGAIPLPCGGRAPGRDAGVTAARRDLSMGSAAGQAGSTGWRRIVRSFSGALRRGSPT